MDVQAVDSPSSEARALLPLVSVIIPVHNDADRLATCLEALEGQSYPAGRYEVIAVDNNSDKSIEPVVAHFGQARAVREEQPGSYAARNRGLALATGAVLAFTDADCRPAPDWIERGVERLQNVPGETIVGGKVDFFFQQGERPGAVEVLDSMLYLDQKRYCTELGFAVTANLFTHRSVWDRAGGFKPEVKSGEDKEWCRRAVAQGTTIAFAENAKVRHPARATLRAYGKKIRRVAAGRYTRNKDRGDSPFELLWDIAGSVRNRLRRGFSDISGSRRLTGMQKCKAAVALIYLEGLVRVSAGMGSWLRDHALRR